jgi:hypothetical protein
MVTFRLLAIFLCYEHIVSVEICEDAKVSSLLQLHAAQSPQQVVHTSMSMNLPPKSSAPLVSDAFYLGPFDSGTHLLEKLLAVNFKDKFNWAFCYPIWKHTLANASYVVQLAEEAYAGRNLSQVSLLLLLRNPISQIASWYQNPYNLKNCTASGSLDQPCSVLTVPTNLFVTILSPGNKKCTKETWELRQFESAIDVYNSYVRQYLDLLQRKEFKSVTLLFYEDLVLDPVAEIEKMADATGWARPLSPQLIDQPAKWFDGGLDSNDAMEKIKQRTYFDHLTSSQLKTIQSKIDLPALVELAKTSTSLQPLLYIQDTLRRDN